jgi:CRP/FNR family cyclic AMP-dependent transcriptional regulator
MIDRFQGDRGKRLLVEEIQRQKLVAGIPGLAEAFADAGELVQVPKGEVLIEQDGGDDDVYLIIAGAFDVLVNKKMVAKRFPGDHVGEMAAISPIQRRSATLIADEDSIVLKVPEASFSALGNQFPETWRRVARELARRLEQRNSLIRRPHDDIRVFVMSSVEALPVAREVSNAFQYDPFLTVVWNEGVFKVSNYTLQSLEDELEQADFAVAVAHADDQTMVHDEQWPTPRDNVVFELGFFMGRLGRQRAILMEPRGTKVKLPSDLAGVTTIPYQYKAGADAAAMIGPACDALRKHIISLGPIG